MPRVSAGAGGEAARSPRAQAGRGFSLIELLVVLAVTVILTGLLLPTFRTVRENALRLRCASNQRQLGVGIVLYATDHNDRKPPTQFASGPACRPQEMMAATVGNFLSNEQPDPAGPWDGLGWLVSPLGGYYVDSPQCLYCPSHSGAHPMERYLDVFKAPGNTVIYTNYHYAGDRAIGVESSMPNRFRNSSDEVLLTDGMRTRSDYNHEIGANVLYGDCAVRWYQDVGGEVRDSLPLDEMPPGIGQAVAYREVWDDIVRSETGESSEK